MSWFHRHIERWLKPWALGELTPEQASRLLRHAHSCVRCGGLYEQWVRAHRALEGGDPSLPSFVERAGLEAAGLDAVLAAAAPTPTRTVWTMLGALGGCVATVGLVLILALPREGLWQVRGTGRMEPAAVLRIFCAAPGKNLRELGPGQGCPPGAKLAFAAGADPALSYLSIQVCGMGEGVTRNDKPQPDVLQHPFISASNDTLLAPISAGPGKESPLERTITLPNTPGRMEVEVVAAFTASREAALEIEPCRIPAGTVVRRQQLRIEEGL